MQPDETDVDEQLSDGEPDGHAAEVDQVFDADASAQVEEPQPLPTDNERVAEAEREVLRAKAEMENFRKRMQRDSDQQLKYANMPLMRDLLDVLDNLHRALEVADVEDPKTKALVDGVSMVNHQLKDALAKYGCKPVASLGETFDPNVHEAISQMPSDEYESGKVMNEVTVGFVLHDRVVRPSHVVVSSGPSQTD